MILSGLSGATVRSKNGPQRSRTFNLSVEIRNIHESGFPLEIKN
jgi:hypothetical protein